MNKVTRIIGIDPGLRNCGWGVLDVKSNNLVFVASGTLHSLQKDDLADRLLSLYEGLDEVMKTWSPDEAAVEQTFVNKDAVATLKLGHARAITLLVPRQHGVSVAEYAPNAVKKTVVGAGKAHKDQVQAMVKMLIPKAEYDSADAADALAIAICHAHQRKATMGRMAAAIGRADREKLRNNQ